eukprot:Nitzschia sp. Nitz4//scaffold759_size2445//147//1275//NITZ4_009294-RA/size2445-processed-gene-0.5-mRNA-1//-1//CDS//3329557644//2616//frame0
MFLCVPDFVYTFCCAWTCLASALNNGYTSWGQCQFQTFYLYFGTSANAWLNGVMAREIYMLLRSSHIRRRYFPPSDKQVYITTFGCYVMALIAATLPLLGSFVEWIPPPGIQAGFLCLPADENLTHTLVFWFLLAPVNFAIPYTYAQWVFHDVVIRSKLLPPRGKRRELTVYFFRIGAMFMFMWMPTIVALTFLKGKLPPWWTWGLGLFSHTQGLISALVAMMKQDIRDAVKDLLFGCFRRCTTVNDGDGDGDPVQEKPALSNSVQEKPALSNFVSAQSSCVTTADSPDKATVDDLGLPIQGSNFLFLDEASSPNLVAEGKNDPEQEISSSAPPGGGGDDGWTGDL